MTRAKDGMHKFYNIEVCVEDGLVKYGTWKRVGSSEYVVARPYKRCKTGGWDLYHPTLEELRRDKVAENLRWA